LRAAPANPGRLFLFAIAFSNPAGTKIYLEFTERISCSTDLENERWGDVFEPRSAPRFSTVFLNSFRPTIKWLNLADFAPEILKNVIDTETEPSPRREYFRDGRKRFRTQGCLTPGRMVK
jgi:hypothetical protein